MRKLLFSGIILFVAVGLMMSAFAAPAMAKDEVRKWRMSNWGPRYPIFEKLYHGFVEDIKKASGGRLIVEDIYDGEGVAGSQVLSAVKSNLTEMGTPYMAYHAGEVPAGLVEVGLPGLDLSLEQLRVLYQHMGWKEVLQKLYAEHKVHWVAEYSTPPSYVLTKEPIKSLDQFKGMKLRAVGANAKFLRNLGGVAVSVSFGEIYTGLATGVFDGVVGSALMDISDGKFYELTKYVYPLPVSGSINVAFIVNMDEWKKLPDDLKFILELCATKFEFDHRSIFMVEAFEKMKVMKAAGLKWSPEPSQADKAKWQEAGRKTWSEYEKDNYSKELLKIQADFMEKVLK